MRSAGEIVGAVFVIVGVLALLGTLGGTIGLVESLRWLWPLLVLGLGLWLIVAATDRRRSPPPVGWGPSSTGPGPDEAGGGPVGARAGDQRPAGPSNAWAADAPGSAWAAQPRGWGAVPHAWAPGGVREQRVLGGIELAGPMQGVPMRIETFIGEIRLDLSQAAFPAGETAVHASAAIGNVRVLLPADLPAAVRVSSLLGQGEALGRSAPGLLGEARAETEDFAGAPKRIRVEAQSLVGEVAVRRARANGGSDPREPASGARALPESPPPPAPAP
ncbi:MAG: cell wall-active antibiotics response protein LiaF [Candidatus Limnocylindrales bacterium]